MKPEERAKPTGLEAAVDHLLSATGPQIRLAAPLGLGKPHRLINAIYRRVSADPSLQLRVFTALSLTPPRGSSDLARRFLGPFVRGFFGEDFEPLDYALALDRDELPANIEIQEFYMASGSRLRSARAQRSYANINYTHVARGVAREDINVLVQKVAREAGGTRLCLSSNPDLTLDLLDEIERLGKPRPFLIAEVDPGMPWVGGSSAVAPETFDLVLELPEPAPALFALPRQPISDEDYAIGIYASALVRDGGTLQIGIGALSDALAQALILRHTKNAEYLALLESLEPGYGSSKLVREVGGTGPFELGLYGASEMVNDAFRVLRAAGVLTRRVVQDVGAMERINEGQANDEDRRLLEQSGHFLNGAFSLGSRDLYAWLRELPKEDAGGIGMTRVSHINQLYGGNERLERAQRRDSRFFNSCMLMTALGAAASDTLEDGRVVSGVGGQYNFVAMGHTLEDSRSVLMFRATRGEGPRQSSNVRWNYGNTTIPRHLRDIAITEYGVADLRDRTDEDCVKAMLQLTAEPFQAELLERAKVAKKLAADFRLATDLTPNNPTALARRLGPMRETGHLPEYPHGTDFTEVERRLVRALAWLEVRAAQPLGKLRLMLEAMTSSCGEFNDELRRMGFEEGDSLSDRISARILRLALEKAS